jgi:elongation factor P hydroxylase
MRAEVQSTVLVLSSRREKRKYRYALADNGRTAYLQVLFEAFKVQTDRLFVKVTIAADFKAGIAEDGGMIAP